MRKTVVPLPAAVAVPESAAGRFAYEGLDRLLHEKARLGILTSLLSRPEGLVFNDLKQLCSLTDGNLSRHIQVLSDAGLVEISKGFLERRPQTLYRLTAHGRSRFRAYLAELERVIRDALPAEERAAAQGRERRRRATAGPPLEVPPGWAPA